MFLSTIHRFRDIVLLKSILDELIENIYKECHALHTRSMSISMHPLPHGKSNPFFPTVFSMCSYTYIYLHKRNILN